MMLIVLTSARTYEPFPVLESGLMRTHPCIHIHFLFGLLPLSRKVMSHGQQVYVDHGLLHPNVRSLGDQEEDAVACGPLEDHVALD